MSNGIIVTGHGYFASGLVSALELIVGAQDNLRVVDFPEQETGADLTTNISKAFSLLEACDRIDVFCDLRGGSPFNTVFPIARELPNVQLYYGTNLPMLLEFLSNRETNSDIHGPDPAAIREARSASDYVEFRKVEDQGDDWE